jgi:hypothetical protein
MLSDHNNPTFDTAIRILSGLSVLGTIVALLLMRVPRHGPEPNDHEIFQMFIVYAQLVLFLVAVITAVIVAGFRGGLRLSRLCAGLSLAAICGLVVELLVFR